MSLESNLVAVLKSVCGRTFRGVADTATARPYVTFQQVGGDVINLLANAVASKKNAVMQITVWSDSPVEAGQVADAIEAALITTTTIQARPLAAAVDDYESDMERWGRRQDFTIWADR